VRDNMQILGFEKYTHPMKCNSKDWLIYLDLKYDTYPIARTLIENFVQVTKNLQQLKMLVFPALIIGIPVSSCCDIHNIHWGLRDGPQGRIVLELIELSSINQCDCLVYW
jgi:hypothetical protein